MIHLPALLKEMWQQWCLQIDNYIEGIVLLYSGYSCLNIVLDIHTSCEGFYSRSYQEHFCSVRVKFIYVPTLFYTLQMSKNQASEEGKPRYSDFGFPNLRVLCKFLNWYTSITLVLFPRVTQSTIAWKIHCNLNTSSWIHQLYLGKPSFNVKCQQCQTP